MKFIYQAFMLFALMSLIAGVFYPALVTTIGQLIFRDKSMGSLIVLNGEVIGSKLIAQSFKKSQYFWPRPSASNFNALPSFASNRGPTSKILAEQIHKRRRDLSSAHGMMAGNIPADLLTTSASGLDPHISLESARMQVKRIAKARGLDEKQKAEVEKLIDDHLDYRQFGILGENRINVLSLNIFLDQCCKAKE